MQFFKRYKKHGDIHSYFKDSNKCATPLLQMKAKIKIPYHIDMHNYYLQVEEMDLTWSSADLYFTYWYVHVCTNMYSYPYKGTDLS